MNPISETGLRLEALGQEQEVNNTPHHFHLIEETQLRKFLRTPKVSRIQ